MPFFFPGSWGNNPDPRSPIPDTPIWDLGDLTDFWDFPFGIWKINGYNQVGQAKAFLYLSVFLY